MHNINTSSSKYDVYTYYIYIYTYIYIHIYVQGGQKVSVHLMITVKKHAKIF
jgi:hypothetical protein